MNGCLWWKGLRGWQRRDLNSNFNIVIDACPSVDFICPSTQKDISLDDPKFPPNGIFYDFNGWQILTALERRGGGKVPSVRVYASLACFWRHPEATSGLRRSECLHVLSALIFQWLLRHGQGRHMRLKSLGIVGQGEVDHEGRRGSSFQGIHLRGIRRAVLGGAVSTRGHDTSLILV